MHLHTSPKSTSKFIRYSRYGVQSHVVINNYGVPFTCNTTALIYNSKQEAEANPHKFYDQIAEIQCIIKIETMQTFEEITILQETVL